MNTTYQTRSDAMRATNNRILALCAVSFLFIAAFAAGVSAQTTQLATGATTRIIAPGAVENGRITVAVGKSVVVKTLSPFKRVNIAQSEVADFNLVGDRTILLTAKRAGATQIIVWDDAERSEIVDVNVTLDTTALADEIRVMFPESKITVTGSGAGTVALRGRAKNLEEAEQMVQLAAPHAPRVLNFLEVAGGQQVMLQVKFAEVSRSATNALGVNLGYTDGNSFAGSNVGQVSPLGIREFGDESVDLGVISPTAAVSLFGRASLGNTELGYFISALRQNNLLRVLAEPNLIAISGQEAEFLAGGEFPVPVPQAGTGGESTITIEYRDFGVKLKFLPVVLGDGRIRLKVSPEVSDLDFTSAVRIAGTQVPGLRKRNLTTTIELHEGQTFAVAGLLDSNVAASKDVTPMLGDLPVIGALFRSVRYLRRETELVVLVTPHIVEPMNPDQVPLAPGESWRHPTEAELFWNRDLGGDRAAADAKKSGTSTAAGPPPKFRGSYGFTPPQREVATSSTEQE
jgi:pilus assembly protein CpaC